MARSLNLAYSSSQWTSPACLFISVYTSGMRDADIHYWSAHTTALFHPKTTHKNIDRNKSIVISWYCHNVFSLLSRFKIKETHLLQLLCLYFLLKKKKKKMLMGSWRCREPPWRAVINTRWGTHHASDLCSQTVVLGLFSLCADGRTSHALLSLINMPPLHIHSSCMSKYIGRCIGGAYRLSYTISIVFMYLIWWLGTFFFHHPEMGFMLHFPWFNGLILCSQLLSFKPR